LGASSKAKGKQALNKSQQYAACGRRTPFPWLLRRHSKGAAVLSVMGARLFAFSWVSVESGRFVPQARLTGNGVFRFITGLVVSLLVALGK
jgi:hypothetical protein